MYLWSCFVSVAMGLSFKISPFTRGKHFLDSERTSHSKHLSHFWKLVLPFFLFPIFPHFWWIQDGVGLISVKVLCNSVPFSLTCSLSPAEFRTFRFPSVRFNMLWRFVASVDTEQRLQCVAVRGSFFQLLLLYSTLKTRKKTHEVRLSSWEHLNVSWEFPTLHNPLP